MAAKTKKADEAQETTKSTKIYKVTCGTFTSRSEALLSAARAKKAGINASIMIEKGRYTAIAAEGISKERAEALKEKIEAAKLQANISEQ